MILAELAIEAGFPVSVISILHRSKDTIDFILDHPKMKAISFVSGNDAGGYIPVYERASKNGKRC